MAIQKVTNTLTSSNSTSNDEKSGTLASKPETSKAKGALLSVTSPVFGAVPKAKSKEGENLATQFTVGGNPDLAMDQVGNTTTGAFVEMQIQQQRSDGKSYDQIMIDAVVKRNLPIVRAMVKNHGKDFNINLRTGDKEETLLHLAVRGTADMDIVRTLVEDGRIDIAAISRDRVSAYQLSRRLNDKAAWTGNPATAYLAGKLKDEALAANGKLDTRRGSDLLRAGADVSDVDLTIKDGNGQTVLHHAVLSGGLALVKRLVGSGASLTARDVADKTAIDVADEYARKIPEDKDLQRVAAFLRPLRDAPKEVRGDGYVIMDEVDSGKAKQAATYVDRFIAMLSPELRKMLYGNPVPIHLTSPNSIGVGWAQAHNVWITPGGFGIGLFSHELGHIVHRDLASPAQEKEITALFANAQEKNLFVTSYGANNEGEYFAEAVTAFVHPGGNAGGKDRQWLRKHDPGMHKLLSGIFTGGSSGLNGEQYEYDLNQAAVLLSEGKRTFEDSKVAEHVKAMLRHQWEAGGYRDMNWASEVVLSDIYNRIPNVYRDKSTEEQEKAQTDFWKRSMGTNDIFSQAALFDLIEQTFE